jgi:serine/threonine protein kinase
MSENVTPDLLKTRTYAEDQDSQKTQTYQDESLKTQTYGESIDSDKTIGYGADISVTDKTIVHNLSIGDKIELNDKEYEILEILSGENKTGEAVIYKVKTSNGKNFTLKLYYQFTNPKDEPNPEALKRIQAIKDPDILELYDYGTGAQKFRDKFCFEISSFAEGNNLLSVPNIREKYTVEFLMSNVIPEIFKGIKKLHSHKIYHCDIKPENVFYLDKEQTDLIIGDYGSAKTFEEASDKQLSYTSTTKGTNFYLAPEQARGIVSEKNDFYSFGMVLFHLLYPEQINMKNFRKIVERQFSRKPIIDFNPEYGSINDLIAGLTLYDVSSRWGEREVQDWLNGDIPDVHYTGEADLQAHPIKLGNATISSVNDLIGYIESTTNWHENLIEDKEGYSLFLRWVSEIQDLERKKVFDRMVRHYQQDGEGYLKEAVLRYFSPERPICIDMKEYDFWDSTNLVELTENFIKHIDDIWKITPLEKIKFYVFQLEFTLRQLETVLEGQEKIMIKSVIEKISATLSTESKMNFDDYICIFYPKLTDQKLINLFYSFNENRKFQDLEGNIYDNINDIGIYFAKNEDLYNKNKYIILEKNKFFKNNYSDCLNLTYNNFLFHVFKRKIQPEIKYVYLAISENREYEITYSCYKSLTNYFESLGINKELKYEEYQRLNFSYKKKILDSRKKIFNKLLAYIEKQNDIDRDQLTKRNTKKFFDEFKRDARKKSFTLNLKEFFSIVPLAIAIGTIAIILIDIASPNKPLLTFLDYKLGISDYIANAEDNSNWGLYLIYFYFAFILTAVSQI